MPLPIAPESAELTVRKVMADAGEKRRFESLGIYPGSKIVLLSVSGGSVIAKVCGVRLALDRSLAMKILV